MGQCAITLCTPCFCVAGAGGVGGVCAPMQNQYHNCCGNCNAGSNPDPLRGCLTIQQVRLIELVVSAPMVFVGLCLFFYVSAQCGGIDFNGNGRGKFYRIIQVSYCSNALCG